MGVIPATGTEVSLGKIARAYGVIGSYPPSAGTNLDLNADLGPELSIPASSSTDMSEDFGGQTTPNDYP